MEVNPVLQREVRGRWRRPLTFIIIFIYATLFASAMGFIYSQHAAIHATYSLVPPESVASEDIPTPAFSTSYEEDEKNATAPGYELFIKWTWVQALLWTLLTPLLTAPSIVGERQHGLLPALRLSPLTASQIVQGKLLSALSFVMLMILVPLPVSALCFHLGGVSPQEFMLAVLLQVAIAVIGATLGLSCSVSARSVGAAIATTLTISIIPATLLMVAYPVFYESFTVVALTLIVACLFMTRFFMNLAVETFASFLEEPEYRTLFNQYQYSLSDESLAPSATLYETRQALYGGQPTVRHSDTAPVSNATLMQAEINSTETVQEETPTSTRQRRELPLASRLQFTNPILQREVRSKLRLSDDVLFLSMYRHHWKVLMGSVILVAIALLAEPASRLFMWSSIGTFWLLTTGIGCTVMCATSFTNEREQNMLQNLLLTPLSPLEIWSGKIGAALVVCSYYSFAMLPVLLLCLLSTSLSMALATLLVIIAAAWFCAAWGLFFSWFCRHTPIAVGGSIAILLFTFLASPFYLRYLWTRTPVGEAVRRWACYPTLQAWLDPSLPGGLFRDAIAVSLVLIAIGCLLIATIHIALRPNTLEKESKSILFMDLTQAVR